MMIIKKHTYQTLIKVHKLENILGLAGINIVRLFCLKIYFIMGHF